MMKRTLAFGGALLAVLGAAESRAAGISEQRRLVPQVVVAVDLPFDGAYADTSTDTYRMVKLYLNRNNDRAGKYAVKLRQYDDATPAAGSWDEATCASN